MALIFFWIIFLQLSNISLWEHTTLFAHILYNHMDNDTWTIAKPFHNVLQSHNGILDLSTNLNYECDSESASLSN